MKLIIKLNVRQSYDEHTDILLQEVDDIHIINAETLTNYGESIAMEHYDCSEEVDGEYLSDSGCIATSLLSIKEVSDEDFEVLKKYI